MSRAAPGWNGCFSRELSIEAWRLSENRIGAWARTFRLTRRVFEQALNHRKVYPHGWVRYVIRRTYFFGRSTDIINNLISPSSPERLLPMWLKQVGLFIGVLSLLWIFMQIVYGLLLR